MFRSLMFVAVISFVGTLIVIPGVAYSFNNAEHFCNSPKPFPVALMMPLMHQALLRELMSQMASNVKY